MKNKCGRKEEFEEYVRGLRKKYGRDDVGGAWPKSTQGGEICNEVIMQTGLYGWDPTFGHVNIPVEVG